MKIIISTTVILALLGSSVGLEDDVQRNHLQNDISLQTHHNQQYFIQQRPILMQNYQQQYVPVPIQMLQRSVYTQQPQAALIIVKAFPVYLTPAQAANLQSQQSTLHQDPRGPNVQVIHYNSAPSYSGAQAGSVYPTAQSLAAYPTAQPLAAYPTAQSSIAYPTAQPSVAYPTAQTPPERPTVVSAPTQANNYESASNSGLFFAPPSNTQGDNYLNQLAQVVAQQYSKSPNNFKAPAIIAGLENFSPEQQKLIKNHLTNYVSSSGESEKQEKEGFGQREIARSSNESQDKYSSKISSSRYPQQSDWRPAHQPTSSAKN